MKRFVVFVLALVLFTAFAWSTAQGETRPGEKVTIVDIRWSEKTVDVLVPEAAEKFMAENPNVEVQVLLYAHPDTTNKIRMNLAAGGDLDTFALSNFDTPEFLSQGLCMEIMPEAFGKNTVQQVVDMWNEGAIAKAGGMWEGKYYGLTYELSNYAAWINTKFMSEAGLNPKTDLPKDWGQFVDVAKKMTVDKGGVRVRNGFATNAKAGIFIHLILHSFIEQKGLSWATEDSYLESLDDPKTVDALRTFTDFVTKHKIWDPGLFDDEREGFGNGLTATFLTGGTWYWGVLEAYSVPASDVAPFPYPRFRGGKDIGGPGYGACVFVNKATEHPLIAWQWADFEASFPNDWMKRGRANQARHTLSDGSPGLDPSLAREYIPNPDVFFAEMGKAATCFSSVHFNEISDAIQGFTSRIFFEGMTVEESLAELRRDSHDIIGK